MWNAITKLTFVVVVAALVGCAPDATPGSETPEEKSTSKLLARAERGDPGAQTALGANYLYGLGMAAKDPVQATVWFQKAAEQGEPTAQYYLGERYLYGDGAPKDHAQAVLWSRKSADQGYEWAQFNMGVIYRDGLGVPKEYTQALAWFRNAAEQGNYRGLHELGLMYSVGMGVARDRMEAHKWLNLAAACADRAHQEPYAIVRDALARDMSIAEVAEAQKRAREWAARFGDR